MKRNLELCIPFLCISLLLLVHSLLAAQPYTLRSYEGKKVSVHLIPPHRGRGPFPISCGRDTFRLADFWALDSVWMPGPHFLAIQYAVRGGSGYGLDYTLLLGVRGGKLRPVFFANTYMQSVGMDLDDSSNSILDLSGNGWNNYELMSTTYSRRIENGRLTAEGEKHYRNRLRFDTARMVFCDEIRLVDRPVIGSPVDGEEYTLTVFNPGDQVPALTLGTSQYCFAGSKWYDMGLGRPETEEDTLVAKTLDLPEVRRKNARVDSLMGHQHGLSFVFKQYGEGLMTGHWQVEVGYDNGRRFERYYRFAVDKPEHNITRIGGRARR